LSAVGIDELTKVFPAGTRALDRLDLDIADGAFFALLGPSGCGKTTLLRTIAGLETPTGGRIRIGGRDVTRLPPGARNVAMVFQDYALFPHMTVAENIAYPLRVKRVPKPRRLARAEQIAESLSLGGLLERRPAQLSGGQQQRVALGRAVAPEPAVFLFDEPLSNLDARLRLEARSFVKGLQHELGTTTIFVTHDQAEALALADRIAVMESGQIRQTGSPREIFHRPATTFVAAFIGSTPMNLLPGTLRDGALHVASATLPMTITVSDQDVIVGIRPEYLTQSEPAPDTLAVHATITEHLGTTVLVTTETPDGQTIRAVLPEEAEPAPGAKLHLRPALARILLYDPQTTQLLPATP
jgi:multiple sugar transport system ATP-binding protein